MIIKNSRLLIIGGTGFIGKSLAKATTKNRNKVFSLSTKKTKIKKNFKSKVS